LPELIAKGQDSGCAPTQPRFDLKDREHEKLGYDIESRVPNTGKLRFIEVKGRTRLSGLGG
jgi:transcriptional regulator CtsR